MDSAETTTRICHQDPAFRQTPSPWSRFSTVAVFVLVLLSGSLAISQTGGQLEPASTAADWTGRPTQGVQANPVRPLQAATTTDGQRDQADLATVIPEQEWGGVQRTPIERRASQPGQTANTDNATESPIWTTLGILCLLLAGVYGFLRLLRRYGGHGFSTPDRPLIHLLDQQKLDSQSSVYLLRIGRRIVVTGSSAAGMSQLSEITDPEEVAELCSPQGADEGNDHSLASLFSGVRPIRRELTRTVENVVEANSSERQPASPPKAGPNREAWRA